MTTPPFIDQTWDHPLLLFLASLGAGGIVHSIFFFLISRKMPASPNQGPGPAMKNLRWPTFFLTMELLTLLLHPALPFPGVFEGILSRTLILLTVLTIAWTLTAMTHLLTQHMLSRQGPSGADDLTCRKIRTRLMLMEKILVVGIAILSAGAALMTIPGVSRVGESLLASAGLAGLVLGLAARPLLTNIIAGIQIALTQPIRIDDVVIANNEWGWIEEIGIAYVVVRIWDLRRLVLPLSYFIEQPFQNWTYRSSQLLGYVHVYADYTVHVGDLRAYLKTVLESTPLWDRHVWNLQVTELDEKGVQLRALFSAKDSGSRWDLSVYVREGLIAYFNRTRASEYPRVRIEFAPQGSDGSQ